MQHQQTSGLISPFSFPSETDARFLLLVLAIIGSTLVLADGFIGGAIFSEGHILPFLASVIITAIVFKVVRISAQRDAARRIQKNCGNLFHLRTMTH